MNDIVTRIQSTAVKENGEPRYTLQEANEITRLVRKLTPVRNALDLTVDETVDILLLGTEFVAYSTLLLAESTLRLLEHLCSGDKHIARLWLRNEHEELQPNPLACMLNGGLQRVHDYLFREEQGS